MRQRNREFAGPLKYPQAESVEFCPTCKCPVIVAPGALEAHNQRVHTPWVPTESPIIGREKRNG